jgi:hypothetical protein
MLIKEIPKVPEVTTVSSQIQHQDSDFKVAEETYEVKETAIKKE